MQDDKKSRKAAGSRDSDNLSSDENQVINQLKAEETPDNLLRLAKRLQDALDEKMRLSRH